MVAKGPSTLLALPDGSGERLEGGYKNEVIRFDGHVLRIETTSLESAEWEHAVLRFLNSSLPEVPVPTGGPELLEDGRVASVFPYIEGSPLDREDEAQRVALAHVLANLHTAGLDWTGGQRPAAVSFLELNFEKNRWWDWSVVEKPSVLVEAYEATLDWLFDAPALTTGLVHGDIYRGNLRMRGARLAGVVDWEEARLDWPAWELANATWEVCKRGDALDAERAERFLSEYVAAGGPGERDYLGPLLRLRLLADVLYSLTSKARGLPFDQAYVDHLLRALR